MVTFLRARCFFFFSFERALYCWLRRMKCAGHVQRQSGAVCVQPAEKRHAVRACWGHLCRALYTCVYIYFLLFCRAEEIVFGIASKAICVNIDASQKSLEYVHSWPGNKCNILAPKKLQINKCLFRIYHICVLAYTLCGSCTFDYRN